MLLSGLQLLTLLMLAVYLGWGVYTLDRRYRRHEEWSALVETLSLLAVMAFYTLEISLLRHTMRDDPVVYMFALLGLFVSGAALYGHMAVSLTSRLLVEVVSPDSDRDANEPRFGPAEALERQHDFQGAIQEYLVLIRIFPKNPTIPRRLAENYLHLKQPEEALTWFQRAFKSAPDDESALFVMNRWVETAQKKLSDLDAAQEAFLEFLHRFPKSSHVGSVRERLAKLGQESANGHHASLELLESLPDQEEERTIEIPRKAPAIGLDLLAETGVGELDERHEAVPAKKSLGKPTMGLEALAESEVLPEQKAPVERPSPARKKPKLGFDALDQNPLSDDDQA